MSYMVEGDNINFCNNVMVEKCNFIENNVFLVFYFVVLNFEFIF